MERLKQFQNFRLVLLLLSSLHCLRGGSVFAVCLRGLCTRNARREYQATHRASGVREACLLWRTDINGAVASASLPTPGPCSELPYCMFSLHRCLGAKNRRIWLGQTEGTMSVLSMNRRRECLTLALFLRSVEMRSLAFDARVSCPFHLGGISSWKSSDGRRLFTIRRPKAGELSAPGPCVVLSECLLNWSSTFHISKKSSDARPRIA